MNMNKKIIAGFLAVTLLSLMPALTLAEGEVAISADVGSYLDVTFQYDTVGFGALSADSLDNEPTPDNTVGDYNVTVDTNYIYKVSAQMTAGELNDGSGHTIAETNMKMQVKDDPASFTNETAISLNGLTELETGIANTVTTSYNGFWLSVPASQYSGTYSGQIVVTYAQG